MKKNDILQGTIEEIKFPNKGVMLSDGEEVIIKNGIPGQKVEVLITKKKKNKIEGKVVQVLSQAPNEIAPNCIHLPDCGGCTYQSIPYHDQLSLKEQQVKKLFRDANISSNRWIPIQGSPREWAYRNKMEFNFGDARKDGPLELGMHKKGAYYDIVTVDRCQIVDEDFTKILKTVIEYFRGKGTAYYKKMSHKGVLRHLVIRKAANTKEILINLVTTTQESLELGELSQKLQNLKLEGEIKGFLHTLNDGLADIVQSDETKIIWGQDYFTEVLLGLQFKISAFSFFQTNSLGAEELYSIVRQFAGNTKDKIVFDLYCGTGTIAQIMSPIAKEVIGIEIVEEAVEAARENAVLNGLDNCKFIAGDVLQAVDKLDQKPDLIILDPPRVGIHPKALKKIIDFGAKEMIYVSCKPTSLVRDLEVLMRCGYEVKQVQCMDMFPMTPHVETVVKLQRQNS